MSTEITTLESLDMAEVQQGVEKHRQMLEQMKQDYLPLLKTPITDKKQLDIVKAARTNFKNTRLEGVSRLDAGCKALYANWKLWVKARDGFEKEFSDVEELFRSKEKAFEEAEERKFLEIAQAEQRRTAARKERMFQIGFRFDGSKYILEGFAELTEDEVSGLGVDDLQLGEWLNDLERQVAEDKERKEEEERTRRIAAEALQKEQDAKEAAMKAEAERIAAQQAEMERKMKEMEAKEQEMNQRILKSRTDAIQAVGGAIHGDGGWGWLEFRKPAPDVLAMTEDDFAAFVGQVATTVRSWMAEQQRIAEEKEQERLAREQQLREDAAAAAVEAERVRLANEAEAKKKQEELAAQQEVERIAALGDTGLAEGLMLALVNIPIDNYTSAGGRAMALRIKKFKDSAIDIVDTFIRENA